MGVTVADRPTFDGTRQREALTALQRASGRDATAIAKDVGLSYPQYNRYLWGHLPLRLDQVEPFAFAYGTSPRRLVDLILRDDISEPAFDMAAYLKPHIPQDDIPAMVERHAGEPAESQKLAADGYIRMAHRAQNKRRGRGARPA